MTVNDIIATKIFPDVTVRDGCVRNRKLRAAAKSRACVRCTGVLLGAIHGRIDAAQRAPPECGPVPCPRPGVRRVVGAVGPYVLRGARGVRHRCHFQPPTFPGVAHGRVCPRRVVGVFPDGAAVADAVQRLEVPLRPRQLRHGDVASNPVAGPPRGRRERGPGHVLGPPVQHVWRQHPVQAQGPPGGVAGAVVRPPLAGADGAAGHVHVPHEQLDSRAHRVGQRAVLLRVVGDRVVGAVRDGVELPAQRHAAGDTRVHT